MDEIFRVVTQANVQRFVEQLYIETDDDRRELFQTLLLSELRRYDTNRDRLAVLQSALRDCEARILKHRALLNEQKAAGAGTDEGQKLLQNLIDLEQLLRSSSDGGDR